PHCLLSSASGHNGDLHSFPTRRSSDLAEGMEGRGLAKGNPSQQNAPRTLGRDGALSARARVREAAERDKQVRFTALLHHVYNVRSEEHTSELQSRFDLVCRLLLEKKNK